MAVDLGGMMRGKWSLETKKLFMDWAKVWYLDTNAFALV
jgi:hypothetical protein